MTRYETTARTTLQHMLDYTDLPAEGQRRMLDLYTPRLVDALVAAIRTEIEGLPWTPGCRQGGEQVSRADVLAVLDDGAVGGDQP